jgi:flagellar biosynthetic protein FlhB
MQINSGIGIFNCGQIMHSVPAQELVQKVVHSIEIFAAPQLARALYFTTEVDQPIPETLYFAVAQVIAYVFSLAQVRPGVDPMQRPNPKIPPSMLFDANGQPLSPKASA